jgi:hypothetical protein
VPVDGRTTARPTWAARCPSDGTMARPGTVDRARGLVPLDGHQDRSRCHRGPCRPAVASRPAVARTRPVILLPGLAGESCPEYWREHLPAAAFSESLAHSPVVCQDQPAGSGLIASGSKLATGNLFRLPEEVPYNGTCRAALRCPQDVRKLEPFTGGKS